MKFIKGVVEKYQFHFDNEDIIYIGNDKICLGGGHAVFLLDMINYTLSIESDFGEYCYRWGASKEPFKDLMLRVGGSYLCGKIGEMNEIDWKKTVRNATQAFFRYGDCKDKEKVKEFLNEIGRIDHNEVRFYDFVCSYAPALWEGDFFEKNYPLRVRVIVEIFERYLKEQLKNEKQETETTENS